jgi:hypothetical protein
MISSLLAGAGWLIVETYRCDPWLAHPGAAALRAFPPAL